MESYPHLAAALQQLSPTYRELWGNEDKRWYILSDMTVWYAAYAAGNDQGYAPYRVSLEAVDAAVVAGLTQLGLPRGPVAAVRLGQLSRSSGRKFASCELILSAPFIVRQLVANSAVSVWETWVHESLHARQPFIPGLASEVRDYVGYEEGMVEGLTRLVCRERAGMQTVGGAYDYYVRCYESLASHLRIERETLYRAVWNSPPGGVRSAFFDALNTAMFIMHGRRLEQRLREPITRAADVLFSSVAQLGGAAATSPDDMWEEALR
jgi:hypothetical protein